MNVKQAYFDFLAKQGAKQKVQAIIEHGINEWKQQQAYEYHPDDNDPGDYSGHCWSIHGKTIGDIAKTDIDVLKAYTGDSVATYTSGCGLSWTRVAERIADDITDCLTTLKGQFIEENAEALFEEYDIEHDESWTEDDIWQTLDEAMILESSASLHNEWMRQEFPEYENDDSEVWQDYLFSVGD